MFGVVCVLLMEEVFGRLGEIAGLLSASRDHG